MYKLSASKRHLSGFTLVELLATVAIIGILAAVLLPAAGKMVGRAQDTQCLQNLHQISVGIRLYAADNDNHVPMMSSNPNGKRWHYYIQSYLESKFGGSSAAVSKVFICPADKTPNVVLTYDMNSNLEDQRFGNIPGTMLLLTESTATYSISGDTASIGTLLFNHLQHKAVDVLYVNGSAQAKVSIPTSTADPALWKPPSP